MIAGFTSHVYLGNKLQIIPDPVRLLVQFGMSPTCFINVDHELTGRVVAKFLTVSECTNDMGRENKTDLLRVGPLERVLRGMTNPIQGKMRSATRVRFYRASNTC